MTRDDDSDDYDDDDDDDDDVSTNLGKIQHVIIPSQLNLQLKLNIKFHKIF